MNQFIIADSGTAKPYDNEITLKPGIKCESPQPIVLKVDYEWIINEIITRLPSKDGIHDVIDLLLILNAEQNK